MPRTFGQEQIGPHTFATKVVEHLALPLDGVVAGSVSVTIPANNPTVARVEWTQVEEIPVADVFRLLHSSQIASAESTLDGWVYR